MIIADAIIYMLTREDLQAAFETAFLHLNPGGAFCTYADELKGHIRQNRTHCSTHARDDVEITLFEHVCDPDPTDTEYFADILSLSDSHF